jgi:hypothetical protein
MELRRLIPQAISKEGSIMFVHYNILIKVIEICIDLK